jgi:hypothetical protein
VVATTDNQLEQLEVQVVAETLEIRVMLDQLTLVAEVVVAADLLVVVVMEGLVLLSYPSQQQATAV